MGYRLHYAQHYAPEWNGGFFNRDIQKWDKLFHAKFADNGWKSDSEDSYEIQRGDVQAYIAELWDLPFEDINEFFPADGEEDDGYTNERVIEVLEAILTSDDDTIHLECF